MFSKTNEAIYGVPKFLSTEIDERKTKYCLCIPIINEGERIHKQLQRAQQHGIDKLVDIIICDGDSTDGSTEINTLKELGVNTLLIKKDTGKQGAQLRMGFWFALERGYDGIITIDGNNKDSIESVSLFIEKLEEGFDFIQGSRYVAGGKAINTPKIRHFAVKFIHSPLISLTARHRFTDSTNAFRCYSKKYLTHTKVQPFRPIFTTYELLAFLSVRASQLGLKVGEVPVERKYPESGKVPTKISFFKGNFNLIKILVANLFGKYNP
ncbi:glycosyltransferase family 2 protein [Flavobacterium channae]|uniref:glycosyltransferase family 2 protein n=1 Tax=Flavobacterium channae TaxID=2897181 RepID=UPI001E54BA78|nr:glycosyltransferase family 2 protein [Flavobacterium channae]UGS23648.1 glycosyltransferase family 2 protein [Flavobacterium channae]